MRPVIFYVQLATASIISQRKQSFSLGELLREIRVEVGRNFSMPSLRLRHPRERNKVVLCLRPAYSRISNS